MTISYNIELRFAEAREAEHWKKLLQDSCLAYNLCAKTLVECKVPLNLHAVHEATYDLLRSEFPSLPAQCVIRIYKDVMSALRTIKSNKHKGADVPQRKSFAMRLDKRLYARLTPKGVDLTGSVMHKRCHADFVTYKAVEELFSRCTTFDPLIFMRDGRFFLCVPFNVADKPVKDDTVVGVDLGLKRFAVTSEGIALNDKEFNARKRKLRYLKRCLRSKADKGSRTARKHLAKLSRREREMNRQQTYKMVNALIDSTEASVIAIEDLKKIKSKTSRNQEGFKRTRHNNMMSQVPFHNFKELLAYKAALAAKQVVTVSPVYTSQTDCRSGKRDGNRQGCRYVCADGVVFDADWNAAVNIGLRSKHPLSKEIVPLDGTLSFLWSRSKSTDHCAEAHAVGKPTCFSRG